jgi:cobalt-zinc-cadmium efflux system membrane fusion protein
MTMATTLTVPKSEGPSARKSRALFWWFVVALAAGAIGTLAYFSGGTKAALKDAIKHLQSSERSASTPSSYSKPKPNGNWDGLVEVTKEEEAAIGFNFATVKAQTEPIRLELTGRTAYDTDTIFKVRPRFDTRVESVSAKIGQKVKTGDPLVTLYSSDLAQAKTDFQSKYVQWQHDLNLYKLRQKLVETGAISQQLWVDTQNDEQKSRFDFNVALYKLNVIYEVPKEEIEPLLERVNDKSNNAAKFGSVSEMARLVLRSKTDGYVITRAVVPGNYYESTDVLMEIAPLDHLWVWVNVYELDQDKVAVGQTMEIQFPFLAQRIVGKVDYVAPEVSKDTRAVLIRASIRNPDARLKADMLVKAMLEIPPVPGQTIIPRLAMVAINGQEYVFVRKPHDDTEGTNKSPQVDRFERRKIDVAQENTDIIVVARGLKPGEVVATNGSLILSQLYEDQRMTVVGLPED